MRIFGLCLFCAFRAFALDTVSALDPAEFGSSKGLKCPIAIVPGQSFGALRLGQEAEALKKMGLVVRPVEGASQAAVVGRFAVIFEAPRIGNVPLASLGTVKSIEGELGQLPACVTYKGKRIPKSSSVEKLARIFKNCKKGESAVGGNITECDGVLITSGGFGGRQKTPGLRVLQ
jgi:hypothetical protein